MIRQLRPPPTLGPNRKQNADIVRDRLSRLGSPPSGDAKCAPTFEHRLLDTFGIKRGMYCTDEGAEEKQINVDAVFVLQTETLPPHGRVVVYHARNAQNWDFSSFTMSYGQARRANV
jgi:hypothetical protein